jgi:Peptidase family S41
MDNKMRRFIFAAQFVMLMTAVSSHAQVPSPIKPTTADAWQALTRADLVAMDKTIRENTPIQFEAEASALKNWLTAGLIAANARVNKVTNEQGWIYTLAAFANGFGDPHLSVNPISELPAARWPGFIVSAVDDKAVVVLRDELDADSPPIGSKIIRCEATPLKTLVDARVFPFVLNPALPSDKRRAITRLFLDRQNPFAPAVTDCDVETPDGKKAIIKLKWREVLSNTVAERAWFAAFQNASIGATPDFGVSEPAVGVTWISVPTFQSGSQTAPKLEALIADVEKRADAMRQGRAIVIDTRGNGGGNSAWARKLAEAIFTKEILKKYAPPMPESGVDWRASAANIDYWKTFEVQMSREFGAFSESRLFAQHVAASMENARDEGKVFYRQGADKTSAGGGLTSKRPARSLASPFKADVYFLSNGSCGSSCLNFADTVLFIPGVKLIGQATSADGLLMDVRQETLPSGMARLTIPQKIARGRARGNMEFYPADIQYDGAWDDASVLAWVMGLIKMKN